MPMRAIERKPITAAAVDAAPAKWRLIGDLAQTDMPVLLEWRDGPGLTGSPEALRAIDELVATGRPVPVTPTGPFLPADRHDEQSAYCLAGQVMMGDVDLTGVPPELPHLDVPPGAIA
jgi:hypothetical protein